jgi:raffinose/stachyose/melibiose transport system substrate-binding protein
MKKWLKSAAFAGVAIATLGTLAGCSGSGGSGTTEISFLMWGDGGESDTAYKELIADFEEENPDISVNAEFFNTNDYQNILKTRMSGGSGPDVYGIDFSNLPDFIRDGFAMDLTDGGEEYLDKLTDNALEETHRYAEDGGSYNVPILLSGNGIMYNVDLFEQAGITEEPTTYSEFTEAADKLLAAGVTPIAMSAQDNWWPQFIVYYALAEHGANEDTAEAMLAGEETFVDNKAWAESLDIVKELVPYYMPNPLGTSNTAAQSAFLAGEAAMWPATWILSDARAADINLGYMNFPTVDEPAEAMWGTYQARLAINPSNGEEKVEAAQRFINYFFQDEVYSEFLGKMRLFPVTDTVEVDETIDPLFPDMQASWEGKEFVALFSPADAAVQNALLVGMQDLIGDRKTTEQVLADLDAALQETIAANQ